MKEEIWKDIPEFEGYYQVSSIGRVRRIRPNMNCSFDVIKHLKCTKSTHGKRVIMLSKGNERKAYRLSTLLHDTFYPDRVGLKYKFKDGDPNNICTDNLILMDHKRWGAIPGETYALTKKIKKEKEVGKTIKELCEIFKLTHQGVRYHLGK